MYGSVEERNAPRFKFKSHTSQHANPCFPKAPFDDSPINNSLKGLAVYGRREAINYHLVKRRISAMLRRMDIGILDEVIAGK